MGEADSKYPNARWRDWANELNGLKDVLVGLIARRALYHAHNESLKGRTATDIEAGVHNWMRLNYVDAVAVGIRRVLDASRGTRSLIKLLEVLQHHSSELSYDRARQVWRDDEYRDHDAGRVYAEFSQDGRNIDVAVLQRDAQRLRRDHKRVLDYVDRQVAHLSASASHVEEGDPTYAELHGALDDVAAVVNKYMGLLDAAEMGTFEVEELANSTAIFDRLGSV